MKRELALQLLCLDKAKTTLTPEIVMEAFRARVKLAHPDTAPGACLERPLVQDLLCAKKILLAQLTDADSACKLCSGVGMVRGTVGYRACVACKGTGVRQ